MRSVSKKFHTHFIPHEGNNYLPHFFREKSLVAGAYLALLLFFFATMQYVVVFRTDILAEVLPRVLIDLVNQDRAGFNLDDLTLSPVLSLAAKQKAEDMAHKSYFAHTSPEGVTPWYWFKESGYRFVYAGENLAVNFSDSVDVERAWMDFPSHRANILSPAFTEIGIATAEGIFDGRKTVFVVQLFGRPAEASKPSVHASAPTAEAEDVSLAVAEPRAQDTPSFVESDSVLTTETDFTKVSEVPTLFVNQEVVVESDSETHAFVPDAKPHEPEVAGESKSYSNAVQRAISNPRFLFNSASRVVALIIIFALFLFVFIEVRHQHPRYAGLGVGLVLFIVALNYIFTNIVSAGFTIL